MLLPPVLGLHAVIAFASPGAPGPSDDGGKAEASAHLARGAALIDAEDLEGALAQFEAAYHLVPSPNIFHNFGIVYQGLGRKAAALEYFQRFLDEAPHPPPAAREHAQRAVQTLLAEVAELRVQTDLTGATIFVDGRDVGRTPRERPIYLDPGPHHLSVQKPGIAIVHAQRLEVRAGQHLTVSARGVPAAPSPVPPPEVKQQQPPPASSPRGWRRPAGWVAAAGAVLAGGVFATEMFLHYRASTHFNDQGCGTTDPDQGGEDCADLARRRKNAGKWAAVSGVSAGALGAAAAVLFLTRPETSGGQSVSLRVSPSLLGLVLQGRF